MKFLLLTFFLPTFSTAANNEVNFFVLIVLIFFV